MGTLSISNISGYNRNSELKKKHNNNKLPLDNLIRKFSNPEMVFFPIVSQVCTWILLRSADLHCHLAISGFVTFLRSRNKCH